MQCPACKTEFELAGRPAGTLLVCHCGERFGLPRKVDSQAQLQCSGCGAQHDPGQARCHYCDRALASTCCPACFAPMSVADRHCSRCGAAVALPARVMRRPAETPLSCPRCKVGLTANLVGDQLFDRCQRCGGIWAHHLAIEATFENRGQRFSVADWLRRVALPHRSRIDTDALVPCPDCERALDRRSVPAQPELWIDVCIDHGIWFDFRELRKLVGRPRAPEAEPGRAHDARPRPRAVAELEDLLEALWDILD